MASRSGNWNVRYCGRKTGSFVFRQSIPARGSPVILRAVAIHATQNRRGYLLWVERHGTCGATARYWASVSCSTAPLASRSGSIWPGRMKSQ